MPELAPHPVAPESPEGEHEVLSPELVMVDPGLRDRLASLPVFEQRAVPDESDLEEAPSEPELRIAPEAEPEAPPPPPPPLPAPVATQPEIAYYSVAERPRRRRWPIVVVALAGAAVAAGAAVMLQRTTATQDNASAADTGQIGRPASSTPATTVAATPPAPATTAAHTRTPAHHERTPARTTPARTTPHTSTTAPSPSTKPKPKPTSTKPTSKPATTSKPKATASAATSPKTTSAKPPAAPPATHEKLAWAPTAGASTYELELLSGSKPVLHVRTKRTSLIIAVRRGLRGPAGSLAPGSYEWIVWPIVRGHRQPPTVRSRLTLPG